jgi:metal transporter CNNM
LIKDKRHWLLITLLLANTVVNEALPMLLDQVVGSDLNAVLAATLLILIFGE